MSAALLHRLKALADETRLKIVRLLIKNDFCVGALACRLGISKAAVSQHLKILREAGLVRGEKRGYWTHYRVQKEALKDTAAELISLSSDPSKVEEPCNQQSAGGAMWCGHLKEAQSGSKRGCSRCTSSADKDEGR